MPQSQSIAQFFAESFSSRHDEAYRRLESCPSYKAEDKKEDVLLAKLMQTMSDSQKKLFEDWREQATYIRAIEDDELFKQGMRDAIELLNVIKSNKTLHRMAWAKDTTPEAAECL